MTLPKKNHYFQAFNIRACVSPGTISEYYQMMFLLENGRRFPLTNDQELLVYKIKNKIEGYLNLQNSETEKLRQLARDRLIKPAKFIRNYSGEKTLTRICPEQAAAVNMKIQQYLDNFISEFVID